MEQEDYIKKYYNKVRCITAVCWSNKCWARGEYPELEVGKTYKVSHIGVLRSSTRVMLVDFPLKEYNSTCFDLYENGELIKCYTQDPRFLAPYIREKYDPEYVSEQTEEGAIPLYLKSIEQEYDVKILLAVESGSRAWGFESKNSDWDVRFIYVHHPEWYFRVAEQRDVIEHMYDDNVDVVGWELRKALSLLGKNNPSLLEWFNSPKVYFIDPDFETRIRKVQESCFNPIKSMYHYNRIYNKHNERYLQQENCNMKRFLYYLRGILACKWIEINKTMPPVKFKDLLDITVEDQILKQKIIELIDIKKNGMEYDMHIVDDKLITYAKQLADYYNDYVSHFRPDYNCNKNETLDKILYDMVNMK